MSDHYHWFMYALQQGRSNYTSQTGGSILWECGDVDGDGAVLIREDEDVIPF